jgi:hypothetical protein
MNPFHEVVDGVERDDDRLEEGNQEMWKAWAPRSLDADFRQVELRRLWWKWNLAVAVVFTAFVVLAFTTWRLVEDWRFFLLLGVEVTAIVGPVNLYRWRRRNNRRLQLAHRAVQIARAERARERDREVESIAFSE